MLSGSPLRTVLPSVSSDVSFFPGPIGQGRVMQVRSLLGPHGLEAGYQTSVHPLRTRCTGSSTQSLRLRILGLSKRVIHRNGLRPLSSTARCFWCSCWCPNNQQRPAGFTFLWSVTIKGMSIPSWTMRPGKCQMQLSWWNWSIRSTKLGICLLPLIRREMTISGLMNWHNPKGFSPALKVDIAPLFSKFALIPKLLESSDSASWFDTGTHPWPPGARWVFWFQTCWAPSAAALGAVFGQRSGSDLPYPCAMWSGWLQRITTPHRGLIWLWSLDHSVTHKLILESELWHHATTGKSMLLLYRFHFLDVCRHKTL